MKGKVLVLGAGVAGMSATLDLANAGCEVYLVEKEKEIGGKAYQYTCKATQSCQKCSACLAFHLRNQVEHHPNVRLLPFSMITGLSGKPGHFKASVRLLNETRLDLGAETTIDVQALLVATGFKPYHPVSKGEYGYGLYGNVMTAYELEHFLRQLPAELAEKPESIGFLQCFGSRNVGTDRSYCSRVCCVYTARLVKKLHYLFPSARIKVFYQEKQAVTKAPAVFWKEMDSAGIDYVRGLPAKVLGYPKGRVTVRYPNTLQGTVHEEEFDWLILASAIIPPQDGLEEIGIRLKRNRHGFFAETELGVSQTGIFLAGACQGPKDIPETIAHAKAASGKVLYYLQGLENI